jgi:hypothetical protein
MPTTFLGLALFVLFVTPGYMWVRQEERFRPRAERTQILEVAELLVFGAIFSLFATALVALLGSRLRPLLDVGVWVSAPEPSTYLQRRPMRAGASLLGVVGLSNLGALAFARWWFSRKGTERRLTVRTWARNRLGRAEPELPRIQVANTPWYDIFGALDKDEQVALLTVVQVDGVVLTGLLKTYDVKASGGEQDLVLQAPITRDAPGRCAQEMRDDFVILPGASIREVFVKVKDAKPSIGGV